MSTSISIDDMLNRLEEDIRKLKIEYDIFFIGGSAKPPTDTRYRVETLIKRLYDARGMTFVSAPSPPPACSIGRAGPSAR